MQTEGKKILTIISVSLFFLLILGYVFFRSYDLLFGIKIKNVIISKTHSSEINQRIKDSILNITGNAKNAVNLTLNGREIFIDKKAFFNETIILLPGYNIITLEAKDKFGHSDRKDYKMIN